LGQWPLQQELLNLKPTAIDSDRMTVSVNAGKGKKDRITLLSAKCWTALRTYYREYKPIYYLFEGVPGKQ
jgi:integrase/recombinase XerD